VTAELTSFLPVDTASAPDYTISGGTPFVDGTPVIAGNFTTTTNATLPGADVIEDVSSAGQTPVQIPFIILSGFGMLVVSLTTTWGLRRMGGKYGKTRRAVISLDIRYSRALGVLVGTKVLDYWTFLVFLPLALAWAFAGRQGSWSGADVGRQGCLAFSRRVLSG